MTKCSSRSPPRGIAPLELVMALPLLLALLVVMYVLGDGMIKVNQTTIAARADAWPERGGTAGTFFFVPSSTRQSLAQGRATQEVKAPQVLGTFSAATSEHTVMSGSWDYRDIDLNHPLSWEAYAKVGGSGLTGSAQALQSLASGRLRSLLSGLGRSLAGDLLAMQSKQAGARTEAQQAARDNRGKAAEDVQEERREAARLREEKIPRLEAEIVGLDTQIKDAVRDKRDQPTIPGHTVQSSAERLEAIGYEQALRPSASPFQLPEKEREDHAKSLAQIEADLPAKIQQKAGKRAELAAAEEELRQREQALAESEKQLGSLDTWDDKL